MHIFYVFYLDACAYFKLILLCFGMIIELLEDFVLPPKEKKRKGKDESQKNKKKT